MSVSTHRVSIKFDEIGRGHVLLDGRELEGVTSVVLVAKAGDLTRVAFTLVPESVDVELERVVQYTTDPTTPPTPADPNNTPS